MGSKVQITKSHSFRLPKIPSLNLGSTNGSSSPKSKTWRTSAGSMSERKVVHTQVIVNPSYAPPVVTPLSPRKTCACNAADAALTGIRQHVRNLDMDMDEFCAYLEATEPYIINMRLRLRDFCVDRAKRYASTWLIRMAGNGIQMAPGTQDEMLVPLDSEFYRNAVAVTTLGTGIEETAGSPRVMVRVSVKKAQEAAETTTHQRFQLMVTHLTTEKSGALITAQAHVPDTKAYLAYMKEINDKAYLVLAWEQFLDELQYGTGGALSARLPPPTLRNFDSTADIVTELKHLLLLGSPHHDVAVVTHDEMKILEQLRLTGIQASTPYAPPLQMRQCFGSLPDPKHAQNT